MKTVHDGTSSISFRIPCPDYFDRCGKRKFYCHSGQIVWRIDPPPTSPVSHTEAQKATALWSTVGGSARSTSQKRGPIRQSPGDTTF